MARWPDVEKLAVAYLNAALSARVATNVPADVDNLPGFVRVTRGPGSDDGITDSPLVDVETFAPKQGDAADLAEDAREAMHALSAVAVNGSLVDYVSTASGPTRVFYSPNVERYVASYRLHLRKRP
jgi:hypothetical protein